MWTLTRWVHQSSLAAESPSALLFWTCWCLAPVLTWRTSIPSMALLWWAAPGCVRWWLARDWSTGKEAPWISHRKRWRGDSCLLRHKMRLDHGCNPDRPPPSWGVWRDTTSSPLSRCMLRNRWCHCSCPSAPGSRNHPLGTGWSPPSCWRRPGPRPDPMLSWSPPPPPSSVCRRRWHQSPGRCCSGWSAPGCWVGSAGFFPPGHWCDTGRPTGRGRRCLGQETPLWWLRRWERKIKTG